MDFQSLQSVEYGVLKSSYKDDVLFGSLRELKASNLEELKKIFEICARLKFVDQIRYDTVLSKHNDIFEKFGDLEKRFQYQLDRLKTYLTLTCIDVASGNDHIRFDEWLTSKLKSDFDDLPISFKSRISSIVDITDKEEIASFLREWINKDLRDEYLNDYGLKRNFVSFINQEIPPWLKEWLGKYFFIYKGKLPTQQELREYYYMELDKKIGLIADYFYYLRNKYTHSVEFIETREDNDTWMYKPPYSNGKKFTISTRVVYENGDRKKPVDWFIGTWSSFSESDFIRLILITQIRNTLLGINDDETLVDKFISRTKYRYLGYQFLEELRINSENIRDWKYESARSNKMTHVPLKKIIADSFINSHNDKYPKLQNRFWPSFIEQQPSFFRSRYPLVSRVNLSDYLELVDRINTETEAIKKAQSTPESIKDNVTNNNQYSYSREVNKLFQLIECIRQELFNWLQEYIY